MAEEKKHTQSIKYSFLKILTGSDLSRRRLALMKVDSVNPGPVIWLTGCMHGDEVGGIVVIHEIFKRIRKNPLLKGSIYAFPLMNPLGFEAISRYITLSEEDLNRSFPGNQGGSFAQRIAYIIFNQIINTNPTLVLDLHNDWRSSIPYTVLDPEPDKAFLDIYEKIKSFAMKTGFLLVEEPKNAPDSIVNEKTLSGSLLLKGIPALTLELGEAFVVNEINVNYGVGSIWNILTSLEMVEKTGESFEHPELSKAKNKILKYTHQPVTPISGIIRFCVKPSQTVKKSQPLARIHNAFGKHLQTISAPGDGIILGISDSSVSLPGLPIIAIGLF